MPVPRPAGARRRTTVVLFLPVLVAAALAVPGGAAAAGAGPSSADARSTVAPSTASPSATPTTTTGGSGSSVVVPPRLSVTPASLDAGATATVTAEGTPGTQVELLAYTRPSTVLRPVRAGRLDDQGRLSWDVRPSASTRFVARSSGGEGSPLVLPVRARVTLRIAFDDDACPVFFGTVFPRAAASQVDLVRQVDERNVLIGRAPVDVQGFYERRRCFSGYTGPVQVVPRLPGSLTWAPPRTPGVGYDTTGSFPPGPDVVVDLDGRAAPRTVVLERGQGLLLKVRVAPGSGARADVLGAVGGGLVGPERSRVLDPVPPPGQVRGHRDFLRLVGVGRGESRLQVGLVPPGGGREEVLLELVLRTR